MTLQTSGVHALLFWDYSSGHAPFDSYNALLGKDLCSLIKLINQNEDGGICQVAELALPTLIMLQAIKGCDIDRRMGELTQRWCSESG